MKVSRAFKKKVLIYKCVLERGLKRGIDDENERILKRWKSSDDDGATSIQLYDGIGQPYYISVENLTKRPAPAPPVPVPNLDTGQFMGWNKDVNDIYNDDDLSWLNEEFLVSVLKYSMEKPSLKVISLIRRPATKPRENYGSTPCLVEVTVKTSSVEEKINLRLVIKYATIINERVNTQIIMIYNREKLFYERAWPEIQCCLHTEVAGFKDSTLTVPKYYCCLTKNVIIMDHLGQKGFMKKKRTPRLDAEHCGQVLKALAHLHAVSAVLNSRGFTKFEKEFPSLLKNAKDSVFLRRFYRHSILALSREVWTWKGYELFGEALKNISSIAANEVHRFRGSNFGRIRTLVHGDCWNNNIMFRYPDDLSGVPNGVALFDFQLCNWGCPAVDLQNFFFVSANMDVLSNHMDELIDGYLNTVHEVLTELNYPLEKFSKANFMADFKDSFLYGLIISFSHHVVIHQSRKLKVDISDLINKEALKEDSDWRKLLQQEHVKNYLKLIFNMMVADNDK